MYEFTHGGLWFRWGALDRASKRLLSASLVSAGLAALPVSGAAGAIGYRIGYRLGRAAAGGGSAAWMPDRTMTFSPAMAGWTLLFLTISALLWWRFSLRQDEMFNRVQNWSLGMAGAWSMALFAGWSLLAVAGAAPTVSPLALIGIFYLALLGFWFRAVRRWA